MCRETYWLSDRAVQAWKNRRVSVSPVLQATEQNTLCICLLTIGYFAKFTLMVMLMIMQWLTAG